MVSDKEFDKVSKEMFYKIMDYNPTYATFLGLHEYDDKMPSLKREIVLEQIELFKKYLKVLEDMDDTDLDFDRKIDRKLAIDTLKLHVFELEEIRNWEKNPDVSDVIGGALFPLFTREFAPFEERVQNMIKRLEKTPKMIEEAKTCITKPVKLWKEMTIEACQQMPMFFMIIANAIKNPELKEKFAKTAEKTTTALQKYIEWVKTLETTDEYAIGKEKFEKLMELRGLWKSDKILALGKKYLRDEKEKLLKICKEIDPNAKWQDVVEKVKSEKPKNFKEVIENYRKSTQRAKEFVIKHDIATMPENETLEIIETPSYLRHVIPFAALFSPGKFEKIKKSIYIVTPYEEEEMLKEHSYPSIINTSVHEAYPGHHLQLTCAAYNPSYVRIFGHGAEFVEGWAHYCEELMGEKGFSQDPKVDLIRTTDIIWRACRIIVDIKLSCGEMSFDEAVEFLVANTGMKKDAAVAEVKRYTQNPGYQLSYLLGKHLIKELKKEYEEFKGDKFSEKEFHDKMLYAGSLPIKYHREILLSR